MPGLNFLTHPFFLPPSHTPTHPTLNLLLAQETIPAFIKRIARALAHGGDGRHPVAAAAATATAAGGRDSGRREWANLSIPLLLFYFSYLKSTVPHQCNIN